jgi:hypothetical protein
MMKGKWIREKVEGKGRRNVKKERKGKERKEGNDFINGKKTGKERRK